MANYFGFQRFGIDGDNYIKGKELTEGKLKVRDRKLKQMYINAYQSYMFNGWLANRIKFSKLIENFEPKEIATQVSLPMEMIKILKQQKHPFKILKGDIFSHYPYGKIFYIEDIEIEAEKFLLGDRVPTGILNGKKVKLAGDDAYEYEKEYICKIDENGSRRFAWIFPSNIESVFNEEKNWYEMNFELPKGSYATELIGELLHKDLKV